MSFSSTNRSGDVHTPSLPVPRDQVTAQPTDQSQAIQAPAQGPNQGAQPGQSNAAPAPQHPADRLNDLHASLFRSVLQTMAGGKRVVQDPQTGEMKIEVVPMSKKGIAGGILAGAISGMMAGMAAPLETDKWGHRQIGPSVAAGAGAAERQMGTAQRMSDEETARAAQVFDQNIKKHINVMNATRLQGEAMNALRDADAPIFEALSLNPDAAKDMKTDLSEDQLLQLLKSDPQHFQRSNALVTDVVPIYGADGKQIMNADGTPRTQYKYALFNNDSIVHMSDKLRQQFPQLANVANGQALPVRVLSQYANTASQKIIADSAISKWVTEYNKLIDEKKIQGDKLDLAAVQQKIAQNPSLAKNLPAMLQSYAGRSILSLDNMSKDAESGHLDRNAFGAFINALGVDTDQLADYRAEQLKAKEAKPSDQEKYVQQYLKDKGLDDTADNRAKAMSAYKATDKDPLIRRKEQLEVSKLEREQKDSGALNLNSGLSGETYLRTLPAGLQSQVRAYGEGRLDLGTMPRGKERTAIVQALTQAYPDYDESKAKAYFKTRQDYTSGKTATGINSYNTAIAHLGTMFDHVSGTNSLQLNNPVSDVHRQLDLDKHLVATELAKAVSNGQMTEGEKNSILDSISGRTVGSYQTRIKEAVELLNGKLDAYQSQWENAMPSGVVTSVKILNDRRKATIDRINGKAGAPAAAPAVGDIKTYNGANYKFDGKQWVKQ